MKKEWKISSEEVKKKCIQDIISFVDELEGDKVGLIAAERLLNAIGPVIYNLGINDARKLISDHASDIQVELDLLEDRP